MPEYHEEELLILTKTYPNPSSKYRETVCVGAVNRAGEMRRLFPIHFRFLSRDRQFRRWQWIGAKITKARDDHRPESYKVDTDSIEIISEPLPTKGGWEERLAYVRPHLVSSYEDLEARRQTTGESIGFLHPNNMVEFCIREAHQTEWTPKQLANLQRKGLFDSSDASERALLEKLRHEFHYRYQCSGGPEDPIHKNMILDWELCQLYRNCRDTNGDEWEAKVREKFQVQFFQKDLFLMMGTVHRFPSQWLIIGVVYPPMPKIVVQRPSREQMSLFAGTNA